MVEPASPTPRQAVPGGAQDAREGAPWPPYRGGSAAVLEAAAGLGFTARRGRCRPEPGLDLPGGLGFDPLAVAEALQGRVADPDLLRDRDDTSRAHPIGQPVVQAPPDGLQIVAGGARSGGVLRVLARLLGGLGGLGLGAVNAGDRVLTLVDRLPHPLPDGVQIGPRSFGSGLGRVGRLGVGRVLGILGVLGAVVIERRLAPVVMLGDPDQRAQRRLGVKLQDLAIA